MNEKTARCIRTILGILLLGVILFYGFGFKSKKHGVQSISFSHESGFYDEPFYLSMECNEGEIYYTLDSSDPDENSIPYTGPIYIQDASQNPNVYCTRDDVTTDFLIRTENGKSRFYQYEVPKELVDKANVVRAVCIDKNKRKGNTICAIYFVGYNKKEEYDGINIISITTDPENLFSYEKGIYVLGEQLEKYCNKKQLSTDISHIFTWKGNSLQKGINWERESNIIFWDHEKKFILSGDYGIRTQGGGGRALLPKSLNIYARTEYGADSISGRVISDDQTYTSMNLNSGSNCMLTKLNDYLVGEVLSESIKADIRRQVFYALFLEGEYWGVYWLMPRYDGQYFYNTYGVDADNIIFIKDNEVEIGNNKDKEVFKNMFEFISENDLSNSEVYKQVMDMINIESCIDYYATEIYIGNVDWPMHNYGCWRSRNIENKPYADCKWRWALFDLNQTMVLEFAETDMIKYTEENDRLFYGLMQSQEFRKALYAKLIDLANNSFNPYWTDEFIEEYKVKMFGIMKKEYDRFYGGDKPISDFIMGCDSIKEYFQRRYKYIIETYGNNL